MARSLRHPQRSAHVTVTATAAVLLAAACGGVDTVPFDDAATLDASDATSMADGMPRDSTTGDGSPRDAEPVDTSLDGASVNDAPFPEASFDGSDAADAAIAIDAFIAGDVGDASGLSEASDSSVASDATDASATSDASDTAVPIDSSDASLAGDSSDASLAGDSSDASLASDSSDASTVSDVADAAIAIDADASLRRDPRLGSTAGFAVFAGSTVTNASGTVSTITGDLGTYPSTTAIGPTPPVVVGAFHLGDTVAQTAAADVVTLYNGLTPASMPGCTSLTGTDLGGLTLAPGIYCFSTSAQLTGALVLDAQANPNAEWFFQIGSTLTTGALGATPASVTVINGGNPCNAFWQVGSSATLGTNTRFSGNIVALASVTLVTGATLVGRALAETGAVAMDTNTVSIAACP
jgi:hypothetical protein